MVDEPVYFRGTYEKCKATVGQFYLMMLTLFVRHGLTKSAFCDILEVIKLMLPGNATIFTSFFKLLSKYDLLSTKTRRIFYCDKCHQKVASHSGPLPCKCKQSNRALMVVLDLNDELQRRLQCLCCFGIMYPL